MSLQPNREKPYLQNTVIILFSKKKKKTIQKGKTTRDNIKGETCY
jgi:hypothetical protein